MNFKSKFNEDEIYKAILNSFTKEDINFLVNKNLVIRSKYGNKNLGKNKIIDKEKAISIILETCKVNTNLKRTIDEMWTVIVEPTRKILNLHDSAKDMRLMKYINEGVNKAAICSVLWTSIDEEKNKLGDEIFTIYMEEKKKEEEIEIKRKKCVEKEVKEVKNKIEKIGKKLGVKVKKKKVEESLLEGDKAELMNMTIGELIENIVIYKEKVENLEEKLIEKNKEIEELKKQLKNNDSKSLAREIKKLGKVFNEELLIKDEQNEKIRKVIEESKKENEGLTKEIMKQNKIIEKIQKGGNKEIKEMLLESQNAIKGPIMEHNIKLIEEIKLFLKEQIKEVKENKKNINNENKIDEQFSKAIVEIPKKSKIEKVKKEINKPSFEEDLFNEEDFEDIFK
ncbi:MAG: hypothetical protein ACRDD2_13385 [Sarcina sp.]